MKTRRNLAGSALLYRRFTLLNEHHLDPNQRNDHGFALGHPTSVGMRLCAMLVLPNELRVMALDTTGEVSEYMRQAHTTETAVRNRRQNLVDTMWSSCAPQISRLEAWADVVAQIVEMACIPVELGLCADPRQYAGFFGPDDWGHPRTYHRPEVLGDGGRLPAKVEINLQPMHAPDRPLRELVAEVNAAIDAALPAARAIAARRRRARRTTGRKSRAVQKKLPTRAEHQRRRAPKPEFIGKSAESHQRELDAWRKRYQALRRAFQRDPTTVFEAGTVRFRMLGARVVPMPPCRPPPVLLA